VTVHEPLEADGDKYKPLPLARLLSEVLYEAERGWRDLKSTIDMRPVYHRREDRIEAHVQLCWLALLLLRVAETETGDTWRNLRNELDRCTSSRSPPATAPSPNAPSSPPPAPDPQSARTTRTTAVLRLHPGRRPGRIAPEVRRHTTPTRPQDQNTC
jgi:hypothetical protein